MISFSWVPPDFMAGKKTVEALDHCLNIMKHTLDTQTNIKCLSWLQSHQNTSVPIQWPPSCPLDGGVAILEETTPITIKDDDDDDDRSQQLLYWSAVTPPLWGSGVQAATVLLVTATHALTHLKDHSTDHIPPCFTHVSVDQSTLTSAPLNSETSSFL